LEPPVATLIETPLMNQLPPTYKLPPIPTPPLTTSAPDETEVDGLTLLI